MVPSSYAYITNTQTRILHKYSCLYYRIYLNPITDQSQKTNKTKDKPVHKQLDIEF